LRFHPHFTGRDERGLADPVTADMEVGPKPETTLSLNMSLTGAL
jgi:hypothetical protein